MVAFLYGPDRKWDASNEDVSEILHGATRMSGRKLNCAWSRSDFKRRQKLLLLGLRTDWRMFWQYYTDQSGYNIPIPTRCGTDRCGQWRPQRGFTKE